MSDKKVWIVTGGSQGLGAAISKAALKAGHHVIATARNPEKAASDHPEITSLGGQWLKLDVTDSKAEQVVADAVAKAGRIDVLVNNAGRVYGGTIEDTSIDEFKEQMDINTWGALRVTKGVIPTMRQQKSGTIVNQGSVFGQTSSAGAGNYGASKFALEGLSETLKLELRPFNIRVLHLVTGFFRTSFMESGAFPQVGVSPPYLEGDTAVTFQKMQEVAADVTLCAGDPKKLSAALVKIVDQDANVQDLKSPLCVPLGRDAVMTMKGRAARQTEEARGFEDMATSLDFDDYDERRRHWPGGVVACLI